MSAITRIDEGRCIGTHLIGTFRATYNELVESLGDPHIHDGYKVTVEWVLEYGGNVYTIYDWKEEKVPVDNPDMPYLFHIGGNGDSKIFIYGFCDLLNGYLVEKAQIEGVS